MSGLATDKSDLKKWSVLVIVSARLIQLVFPLASSTGRTDEGALASG